MFNNNNPKIHYKMYKAGKHWIFASLTLFSLGLGGVTLYNHSLLAQAATIQQEKTDDVLAADTAKPTEDNDVVQENPQQRSSFNDSNKDEKQQVISVRETTDPKNEVTNSEQQTPQVTADSTHNSGQSEASNTKHLPRITSQTVKQEKVQPDQVPTNNTNQQAAQPTQAAAQKEEMQNQQTSSKKELSYQDLLHQLKETNNNYSHVNKDNFLDYFVLNGDAVYDPQTGIVTLVPNKNDQVGNFTLKNKINLEYDFKLTGSINLGTDKNGADGIGLAFHNGNTNDVGISGGNNGIAGLENAFGFKLDTWHNDYQAPNPNGNSASDQFGWDQDPNTGNQPFGGFVTTSKKHPDNDPSNTEVWWAETAQNNGKNGYQILTKDIIDGRFHDFTIEYDGKSHVMTLTLQGNGQSWTWSKEVNLSNFDNNLAAFMMAASTGGAKNLHQFQIDSFDYVASKKAVIHYIDQNTGQELSVDNVEGMTGENIDYSTAQKITGYQDQGYELVTDEFNGGQRFDNDALTDQVFNVYLKHGIQTIVDKTNTITNTVHFIDEDGNELAEPYSESLNFEHSYTFDKVTGQMVADSERWSPAQRFNNVAIPEIAGYHSKNEAPLSEDVNYDSADTTHYIVYSKDPEPVAPVEPAEPTQPIDPVKPVEPTEPVQPIGPAKPVQPTEPILPVEPVEPNNNENQEEQQTSQTDTGNDESVLSNVSKGYPEPFEKNPELSQEYDIPKKNTKLGNNPSNVLFNDKKQFQKSNDGKLAYLILEDLPRIRQEKSNLGATTSSFHKINIKDSLKDTTDSKKSADMPTPKIIFVKTSAKISEKQLYQQNQTTFANFEKQLKKVRNNNPDPKKNNVTSLGNYLQTMSGKVIAGTVKI
jgi:outer membrane biosynthesis protein TonB